MRWPAKALLLACPIIAGQVLADEADLKRQIEVQAAAIADFQRLDTHGAARDEIRNLSTWLEEARKRLTEEEEDVARLVLDRCVAQAELIRQKTIAAQLKARADQLESRVRAVREHTQQARAALQAAFTRKKELEGAIK